MVGRTGKHRTVANKANREAQAQHDETTPDVFSHVSVVDEAGYGTLPPGAMVTCEVTEGRRGPVVASILAVDASNAMTGDAGREERWRGRRDREGPGGAVEECRGVVKFYDAVKRYGFVVPDGGGRDVFLHGSVLNRAGLGGLEAGQHVSVMVEQGTRGPQATDIELI